MTNLTAYHNNQANKDAIIGQLKLHCDADEIIKGQYWEDGKGCAVGCTIHSDNHAEYEARSDRDWETIASLFAWLL